MFESVGWTGEHLNARCVTGTLQDGAKTSNQSNACLVINNAD